MPEAFEYAIKKDVRNNAIVREVDEAKQRDLWKSAGVAGFLALVLLFSAWQHYELLRHGYQMEQLEHQREVEQETSRRLRLEVETLRSPARIEALATGQLHLVAPSRDEAIVIERVVPADPTGTVNRRRAVSGRIRRALTRQDQRTGSVREPIVILKRRIIVIAVLLGLWAVGIKARLVKFQVFDHADLVKSAESQQSHTIGAPQTRRHLRSRRPSPGDERGRRLYFRGPSEISDDGLAVSKLCEALGDCTAKERQTLVDRLSKQKSFAYIRRQVSPEEAKRVAALNLDGIRSSRRASAPIRIRSSRRTCSAGSVSTTTG